jgi:uncharacterized protein
MRIECHVHISTYMGNGKSLEEVRDLLLREMKNSSVDYAIVIPDNIENDPKIADLHRAQELIAGIDNLFLLGSPHIILRGTTELQKYERLLKSGIIKGLKLFPGHDPYYPTDERCLPYYNLCQQLGTPIIFHTGENSGDSECAKYNDPKFIVEIANKYPRLKVVIAHYFWPKIDYCYQVTKDTPNIYFDLAATADQEVLDKSGGIEKMRQVLSQTIKDRPDNVVLGSDWPMCSMKEHIALVRSLSLGSDIEEKIFSSNAISLYQLFI